MANQFQGLIRFFLIGSLVTVFLLTKINTFTLCFKVRSSTGPWPVPPGPRAAARMQLPFPAEPTRWEAAGPTHPPSRGLLLAAPHVRAAALPPVLGDQEGTAASENKTSGPQPLLLIFIGVVTEPLWNSVSSSLKWLEVRIQERKCQRPDCLIYIACHSEPPPSSPPPWSQTESIWVWPAFQDLCCLPSWTSGPWWMASHQCQDQGEAPRECLAIQDPHLTSPSGCTRWGPRGSGRGRFAGGSRQ